MTNALAGSASPYLLQHAHNPVDWYPWEAQALEKARREDKPIFLSIGYAACHWCHVMAHESFEDPATAAILNEHFVSIKVDREQRPDLDGIYMNAVVSLTGQGGWPMSVFLTPELQPFYAGTYFPPVARHGLPAFRDVLLALAHAWQEQREQIRKEGARITAKLQEGLSPAAADKGFTPDGLISATQTLLEQYDREYGGWGGAPKFPQPMAIEFLLRRAQGGDPNMLKPATHALKMMQLGGMYDVVGGGFSRYSTDDRWHIPHFEKMLYDNAQLARVYLHAWQMTGEAGFQRVVHKTLDFVERELLLPEGGFASSLDADSEGEEGKFYTWTKDELDGCLGEYASLFDAAYGITAAGNRGGKIVLQRAVDDATLAGSFQLSSDQVVEQLTECHRRLLEARSQRVRPGTDDKVLVSWNSLMLAVFAEAGRVLGEPRYLTIASKNADFLLTTLVKDGRLHRTWRRGVTGEEVFLEDHAALILGLLELYQSDFNNRWYAEACTLARQMLERFEDPAGGFFDTPADGEALPIRPKELQDNATPCGNSLAAEALLTLTAFGGEEDWRQRAEKALAFVSEMAPHYPTAFGRWLCAADFSLAKVKQVAISGELSNPDTNRLIAEVRKAYRPNLVLAASAFPAPEGAPELLTDRPMAGGKATAYVCEGFVCRLPVTEAKDLEKELT